MNCPNCNSDELKPYKNYICCYSCGELITNKTNTMNPIELKHAHQSGVLNYVLNPFPASPLSLSDDPLETATHIIRVAANYMNAEIDSKSRREDQLFFRYIIVLMLDKYTNLTYQEIADVMGQHRANIYNTLKQAEFLSSYNNKFIKKLKAVDAAIGL